MSTQIKVPTLGESISEATVAKWFKKAGEFVKMDEPLVELETDKVTVEVPSPVAGTLSEIKAPSGSNVEVGGLLGLIVEGVAAASSPKAKPSEPVAAIQQTVSQPVTAFPAAKKLAADSGVSLSSIKGSGKNDLITKGDVLSSLRGEPPSVSATINESPKVERVPMTRLRKRIAERLKEAQNTAAMLTTFNEVDMTALMELRTHYKDQFEKKHGIKLGFMSFFLKATISALQDWPALNAEIDGDDLVYKHYYDIGVAVGTPQGLVVPIVRNADSLSFSGIEKTIAGLGEKARTGKLTMNDLSNGTFTISNGGVYGSLMSTPILNPPQSGILGMHKIQNRAMVMPDGSIKARPMMYLALSYDHRIVDGREAVSFLVRIKDCIEDPSRIFMEV